MAGKTRLADPVRTTVTLSADLYWRILQMSASKRKRHYELIIDLVETGLDRMEAEIQQQGSGKKKV